MSHNTTSWKSHTSTWRWTDGNDGRSPEGGKARQVGGHPALAREKAIGQHDQGKMAMQTIPASALVMVQAALPFGILIKLLNRPAAMRQFNQSLQGRVRREVAEVPFDLAALAWHRAFAEQPPFRAGGDPVMARRELRTPCRPVGPHGHELFAQDYVVMLAPGDRLPALLRQGRKHSLGLIEWSGAGLARLAPPPWTRGYPEGSGLDLRWQAHPERTAHPHHVGELPVVEALEEGGIVAIAGIRDHRGKRDAPRPRLIHQRERKFGLCLKGHLGGHMDLAAAGGICGPAFRQIKPCREGPMHWGTAGGLIRDVVRADDDLTIGDLA